MVAGAVGIGLAIRQSQLKQAFIGSVLLNGVAAGAARETKPSILADDEKLMKNYSENEEKILHFAVIFLFLKGMSWRWSRGPAIAGRHGGGSLIGRTNFDKKPRFLTTFVVRNTADSGDGRWLIPELENFTAFLKIFLAI